MGFKTGRIYKRKDMNRPHYDSLPDYFVITKISPFQKQYGTVRYITILDVQRPHIPEMEFEYWYMVDYYKEANDE